VATRLADRRAEDGQVFVAVKRKIQPGDRWRARHGNKGVVSRTIVSVEALPSLRTGR